MVKSLISGKYLTPPDECGYEIVSEKKFEDFLQCLTGFEFTGKITYAGDIYVDIVAVPKGIQEILPFTLPMPFVHSRNAEYNSRNSYHNFKYL